MRYKILTTEEFIQKAREVHGDKYDYSKVEYINSNTKVCIICPEHGEFWQTPNSHLNGSDCYECGKKKISKKNSLTTEEFIKRAREVHGDKYDYSKVEYVNNHTKVCIVCPEHGEFWQRPSSHLIGNGCKLCANRKLQVNHLLTTEEFIKKARKVHGNKYDYSKVQYIDAHTKVCIICPEHGEFWQTPNSHLVGGGCIKCYNKRRSISQRLTTEEFIEKAREVHGDKYDYSKVQYTNCSTNVCIVCHKKDKYGNEHGEFWQRPDHHITSKSGCPICQSKHLEEEIRNLLIENNINFEQEKKFDWLFNIETNYPQYLDFYLPDYNIAIECQGEQHFESTNFFGGEEEFTKTKSRDLNKFQKCIENNINVLYFGKNKFKNLMFNKEYFSNKNELIKKIRELKN